MSDPVVVDPVNQISVQRSLSVNVWVLFEAFVHGCRALAICCLLFACGPNAFSIPNEEHLDKIPEGGTHLSLGPLKGVGSSSPDLSDWSCFSSPEDPHQPLLSDVDETVCHLWLNTKLGQTCRWELLEVAPAGQDMVWFEYDLFGSLPRVLVISVVVWSASVVAAVFFSILLHLWKVGGINAKLLHLALRNSTENVHIRRRHILLFLAL